jgi:DNA-binding IclR family transcriptional regulator
MKQDALRKLENGTAPGRNSTADRTIDVLTAFDEEHPAMTAEEISERLGMSRSTTYRYLQSLRASGLIEEGAAGGEFRLGPLILNLAHIARKGIGLSEIALPVMRELTEQTGETSLLVRLSNQHVVCIERVESPQRMRLSYERGTILPINAGGAAKVLLAYLKPDELDALLKVTPLQRYTDTTITDPDILRKDLATIRAQGYAVSNGELDFWVRGVSAPILNERGQAVASLTTASPAFRLDDAALPRMIQAVQDAANTVSQRLREQDK